MLKLAVKALLRLIPKGTTVPVFSGPMRGSKWVLGCGNHSCWLGTYEARKQKAFIDTIKAASESGPAVIFDIGANVGFYTLLAATCHEDAQVHAFEPFPENVAALEKHIAKNRLANATVHHVAVTDESGQLRFAEGACPETGRIDNNGELVVSAVSVDEEIEAGRLPHPNVVKIDVEGAEANVLLGMKKTLISDTPVLLVALHGSEVRRRVEQILRECDYNFEVQADPEPGFFELYGCAANKEPHHGA